MNSSRHTEQSYLIRQRIVNRARGKPVSLQDIRAMHANKATENALSKNLQLVARQNDIAERLLDHNIGDFALQYRHGLGGLYLLEMYKQLAKSHFQTLDKIERVVRHKERLFELRQNNDAFNSEPVVKREKSEVMLPDLDKSVNLSRAVFVLSRKTSKHSENFTPNNNIKSNTFPMVNDAAAKQQLVDHENRTRMLTRFFQPNELDTYKKMQKHLFLDRLQRQQTFSENMCERQYTSWLDQTAGNKLK